MPRSIAPVVVCILLFALEGRAFADSPTLQLRGIVVRPGGEPAAHARLRVFRDDAPSFAVSADRRGRFQFSTDFLRHSILIAESADRLLQRRVAIGEADVRSLAQAPLRIELREARPIKVRVTTDGKPAAGALVAVDRTAVPATADRRGEVSLFLPPTSESTRISAWHPELGIAGTTFKLDPHERTTPTVELPLQGLQSRRIRVVDHLGQSVPGFRLCPNFKPPGSDYFLGRSFDGLVVTTDTAGMVDVAWAPREFQYVSFDGVPAKWIIDDVKQKAPDNPETTLVQVRRKRQFQGRLAVPENCDPTGLFITAQGFGPQSRGDYTSVRVDSDGRFSLMIAPEYAYAIAVCDREWTSDPLTGVLARLAGQDEAAPLELRLQAAAPLVVKATIGANHVPLEDAYVSIQRTLHTEWLDANGERRRGVHDISNWITTDNSGAVRAGLARATYRIVIHHENWRDEKSLEVKSQEPIAVTFHKPYEHRREIRGQLVQADRREHYSGVLMTVVEYSPSGAKTTQLKPLADGSFAFLTDCQKVNFFAFDQGNSTAGSAGVGEDESAVMVPLLPTATYEGSVVSPNDRPVPIIRLTLAVQVAPSAFARSTTTDREGRFRFERVIPGIPMRLSASVAGNEEWVLDNHYFEPGENRQGAQLRLVRRDDQNSSPQPKPLLRQLEDTQLDARLAHMHVLVAVHHDNAAGRKFIEGSVLDYEEVPAILDYLPLLVHHNTLRLNEADYAYTQSAGWPMPSAKQVGLVAIDGTGKILKTSTVSIDSESASRQAGEFLEACRPASVDADKLWENAIDEAKKTTRRVLVQFGGPRCGPCFALSRWTERHREQLEKDYVLLKLHPGRDAGATELETRIRSHSGSIPWMAIVDTDEKVLATSDGPLGNIGFPGSVEGIRHFQSMLVTTAKRLTAEEIAGLVASLRK